jgi:hypothetical protein
MSTIIQNDRQSIIDLAILGYGNQSAQFKVADDNNGYVPTQVVPYVTINFPESFEVGSQLAIDVDTDQYLIKEVQALQREKIKTATLP